MARKVNQVLWDEWRQRVKRQRDSGLSIAEFCRREKVSAQSFHVWKRKLRRPGSVGGVSREPAAAQRPGDHRGTVTTRRGPRRVVAGSTAPTGSPGFLELPVAAVRPSPFIEVALADGTVIRLPQQNVAALVAMLRVLRGDYFVFVNRSRNRCKILFWDRDGLVVWAKRLERGSFQLPPGGDAASLAIEVDAVTLAMMIGGVDLGTAKRRKRYRAAG